MNSSLNSLDKVVPQKENVLSLRIIVFLQKAKSTILKISSSPSRKISLLSKNFLIKFSATFFESENNINSSLGLIFFNKGSIKSISFF